MVGREVILDIGKVCIRVIHMTHKCVRFLRDRVWNYYLRFVNAQFFLIVGRFRNILLVPNNINTEEYVVHSERILGRFSVLGFGCHCCELEISENFFLEEESFEMEVLKTVKEK